MSRPLFPDEIPVSESEVQTWLDGVPNLSASPFRREAYRKAYNVEAKIRAAKTTNNSPSLKSENQKRSHALRKQSPT